MKRRPFIAVTGANGIAGSGMPCFQLDKRYPRAIARAGAVPALVLAPGSALDYAESADGLMLSGGRDISASLYGEAREGASQEPDLERDSLELALVEAFIRLRKPILGICRGFQLLNVRFGGSLLQDIPNALGTDHSGGRIHHVDFLGGSLAASIFGPRAAVNSYHHQAIAKLGGSLRATAFAGAGAGRIIEAFEHESLPILAVQWHPERSLPDRPRPGADPLGSVAETDMSPLFERFVALCRRSHRAAPLPPSPNALFE